MIVAAATGSAVSRAMPCSEGERDGGAIQFSELGILGRPTVGERPNVKMPRAR